MAYWHELTRRGGGFSRYSANHRTRQVVQRSEQNPEVWEAYFLRQTTAVMHPRSEDCIQLWPVEPITSPTAKEAIDKALLWLEGAASETQDELFEKRPCPMPIHRKKVLEVRSPTHRAVACIYKHTETRYEVRYFGDFVRSDQEEGWRLSVPAEEGETVPKGYQFVALADDLKSAREIATADLERIVASGDLITSR